MKIFIEKETERDSVSLNNYVEKVLDKVLKILTATKTNLDKQDEFLTAFNLLMAKNKLTKLLHNITDEEAE